MDINAHLALARSGKQVPPKPAVLGSFFNFPRWFLWNSANKTVWVALAFCTLWSLWYFLSVRYDFGLLRIFTSGNTRKCLKKMQPISDIATNRATGSPPHSGMAMLHRSPEHHRTDSCSLHGEFRTQAPYIGRCQQSFWETAWNESLRPCLCATEPTKVYTTNLEFRHILIQYEMIYSLVSNSSLSSLKA